MQLECGGTMRIRGRLLFGVALAASWLAVSSCGGGAAELPLSPTPPALSTSSGTPSVPADPEEEAATPPPMPAPGPAPMPAPPPSLAAEAVLVGVGDIALCGSIHRAAATARLMESLLNRSGGIGITLGDNSNNEGRPEEYANCFGSTWGRLNVKPSPGNHDDYDEKVGNGGTAYFQYFGAQAGPAYLGYYSFNAGSWHVVSLNSEIMQRGSREQAQLAWLRSDLASNAEARCALAYFHRPMVSSGEFGARRMTRLWEVLYAAGVEVVVNGHEHYYERFAAQTPRGNADPAFGIRQFIVGTGGAHFHRAGARAPNSEIVIQETLGVIKLTLRPSEYDWEFIDVGGVVRDSGNGRCHGAPPAR